MTDLDELLLGAPLTLTPVEVIARAGATHEIADAVWSALGFPLHADDDVAFTELDVEALRASLELLESGLVDVDTWLVMARTMGQALSRLAEAQLDLFRKVSADLEVDDVLQAGAIAAGEAIPRIEAQLLYVWRRQFAAAVHRAVATTRAGETLPTMAIGFIDIVNYTSTIRDWTAAQLERTLETFERDVALRVAAVDGRVVKTLGDGVLYTAPTSLDAVTIALDTVDAHDADEDLPSVRAGVAAGPVVVRLGDVYGSPVNLASRLSDEARPSSVLVDRAVATDLEDSRVEVRPLARRSVRGFRSVSPFLVRRLEAPRA